MQPPSPTSWTAEPPPLRSTNEHRPTSRRCAAGSGPQERRPTARCDTNWWSWGGVHGMRTPAVLLCHLSYLSGCWSLTDLAFRKVLPSGPAKKRFMKLFENHFGDSERISFTMTRLTSIGFHEELAWFGWFHVAFLDVACYIGLIGP